MKKLFMFAAAALVIASSCTKPSDQNGVNTQDGQMAGLKLSLTLPSGGNTRYPDDYSSFNATAAESTVSTIFVWVFDTAGNAVATGSYFELAIADFDNGGSGNVWEYTGTALQTTAGEVRIWVGANIPDAVKGTAASEGALLARVDQIADMSGAAFAMFSDVEEMELVPAGENNYENEVAVPVYRVVSKIVATISNLEWRAIWAGTNAPQIVYNPALWRVVQYAKSSYVAPHYDVALWNSTDTKTGYAITYKDDLSTYSESMGTSGELKFPTLSYFNDTRDYVAEKEGLYIGENASKEWSGSMIARNGDTTYAFVATTVTADAEAEYNAGVMEWKSVTLYGAGQANPDIFVVTVQGVDYITSTIEKAEAIRTAFAAADALKENYVLSATETLPNEITIAHFFERFPQYDYVEIYKYPEGYVHFMAWVNRIENEANHYDILRNQFIQLSLNGMNPALNNGGNFPGYPGQDPDKWYDPETGEEVDQDTPGAVPGDPKTPIDPMDDSNDNNPDPLEPTDPVDPIAAMLKVSVSVQQWTYFLDDILLGR